MKLQVWCFLILCSYGKRNPPETTPLPTVLNATAEFVPAMKPEKGNRALPPIPAGPPTNLESQCGEENTIYVESSIPVLGVTECQQLCKVSESCKFFTWNSGKCGIRHFSPDAIINASPLQIIGTKTDIFNPVFKGKVFVGKALEIDGGNSLDCQRSCQSNYYCLSWTWNSAGGLNPEICVHNYGRTERKLSVPSSSNIVSGPKYCKAELKYQCCTVSLGGTCEKKEVQLNRPTTCDEISLDQFSLPIATLYPLGVPKDVLCDVTTDVENCIAGKGPWTVIQRRGQFGNPKDYFSNMLWLDYVNGFGNPSGELWLGLSDIAVLTSTGQWELRVDTEDFAGKPYFALYNNFRVNFDGPFSLSLSGYDAVKSTLKDSLSYADGAPFSTSDNDNDNYTSNCASIFKGAWWYTACHASNLNGFNFFSGNLPESSNFYAKGIIWKNENNVPDHDYYFSWPKVEMKIRRKQ